MLSYSLDIGRIVATGRRASLRAATSVGHGTAGRAAGTAGTHHRMRRRRATGSSVRWAVRRPMWRSVRRPVWRGTGSGGGRGDGHVGRGPAWPLRVGRRPSLRGHELGGHGGGGCGPELPELSIPVPSPSPVAGARPVVGGGRGGGGWRRRLRDELVVARVAPAGVKIDVKFKLSHYRS